MPDAFFDRKCQIRRHAHRFVFQGFTRLQDWHMHAGHTHEAHKSLPGSRPLPLGWGSRRASLLPSLAARDAVQQLHP